MRYTRGSPHKIWPVPSEDLFSLMKSWIQLSYEDKLQLQPSVNERDASTRSSLLLLYPSTVEPIAKSGLS